MKCSKCGTENIAGARFCRHCGDSLANAKNIMDLYPKLNFVPTNFMDWKKPVVGMIIKGYCLFQFFCLLLCVCIVYGHIIFTIKKGIIICGGVMMRVIVHERLILFSTECFMSMRNVIK